MKEARGAALIITVWLVAMASVLGLNYSLVTRGEVLDAARTISRQQARAAAQAGVWRFVYELSREEAPDIWPADGRPVKFAFAGARVRAAAQDLSGLVDLNTATPDSMLELTQYLFGDPKRAAEISDLILDWRDADHIPRPHGAEDSASGANDTGYSAKDAAFNSVDELELLRGITIDEYVRLRPFVTVHGENATVNAAVAPARMQAVLRQSEVSGTMPPRAPRLGAAQTRALLENLAVGRADSTFDIFASAEIDGVTRRLAATIVIHRSGAAERPFTILSWRESWPWDVARDWTDDVRLSE